MKNKILLLFVFLLGCKGVETISHKSTVRDSVVFREVEKEVLVPGYKLEGVKFNIDSLVAVIRSGVSPEIIERTLVREDPETKARVKILIDKLGNLTAVCEQQDEIISVLIEERETYRTFTETIIQREKENFFRQVRDFFKYALLAIGLAAILFFVFRLVRK